MAHARAILGESDAGVSTEFLVRPHHRALPLILVDAYGYAGGGAEAANAVDASVLGADDLLERR
jgi:hypothetical protein